MGVGQTTSLLSGSSAPSNNGCPLTCRESFRQQSLRRPSGLSGLSVSPHSSPSRSAEVARTSNNTACKQLGAGHFNPTRSILVSSLSLLVSFLVAVTKCLTQGAKGQRALLGPWLEDTFHHGGEGIAAVLELFIVSRSCSLGQQEVVSCLIESSLCEMEGGRKGRQASFCLVRSLRAAKILH